MNDFILQKDTNFLGCTCGSGKFYIACNGVGKNEIHICCAECKTNTGMIYINEEKKLELIDTDSIGHPFGTFIVNAEHIIKKT